VEVWDAFSDILLYDLRTNTLSTCPGISTKSRENLPNWSPDGRFLYYINAPEILPDESNLIHARYDLMRIGYNAETGAWGDVDTVLSSELTEKSITFPNISPDGRYILFCMIDHSYFSIFDKNSDLYLLDLETGAYREASALNSSVTDSYHAWSKNGRWVVFSSKRLDEVCTHPYFAYFDKEGRFHKPFILPQEDPRYYLSNMLNYNLPVLVDGKVEISARELRDFITQDAEEVGFDESITGHYDAMSAATTQPLH
jgi:Tol biopolymer transport system component